MAKLAPPAVIPPAATPRPPAELLAVLRVFYEAGRADERAATA